MRKMKQMTAGLLAVALGVTLLAPVETEAAKKPALSKKKLTLTLKSGKKTAKLQVKKATKAKITWKSSKKKVATVKKAGKYAAKVTAKKAGKTTITCTVKKNGKTTKLTCKVTVKKAAANTEVSAAPSEVPSATPSATPVVVTPVSPAPTVAPTPEVRNPQSMLEAYQDIFPYIGNCVNFYNGQVTEAETLAFVKKHHNSITMENEMKPESILGNSATTITKEEALAKGYKLPDTYVEETVPQLNLDNVDQILQFAYDNGLKLRGHTLVWHSQTPEWFFKEGYGNGSSVTPETMDARTEFYVATVMSHILAKEVEITGEAGSIVYAWDITNEYLHRSTWGNWVGVYRDLGMEPTYVKKSYEVAYAQLEEYNAQDKVTLFYNDYDTYFNVEDVIELVNYINEGATDKNGNPVKICGGIGMQSHLDVDRPTLEEYGAALDAFIATGLEVQITELDITINWNHTGEGANQWDYTDEGQTAEDQAAFVRDLMALIVGKQKNRDTAVSPKGITGITVWGLCDAVSWRGGYQGGGNSEPTFFGSSINDPKPSYTEFINASELWYE